MFWIEKYNYTKMFLCKKSNNTETSDVPNLVY